MTTTTPAPLRCLRSTLCEDLAQRLNGAHHVYLQPAEVRSLIERVQRASFKGLQVEIFRNSEGANRIIENQFMLTGDGCLLRHESEAE